MSRIEVTGELSQSPPKPSTDKLCVYKMLNFQDRSSQVLQARELRFRNPGIIAPVLQRANTIVPWHYWGSVSGHTQAPKSWNGQITYINRITFVYNLCIISQ